MTIFMTQRRIAGTLEPHTAQKEPYETKQIRKPYKLPYNVENLQLMAELYHHVDDDTEVVTDTSSHSNSRPVHFSVGTHVPFLANESSRTVPST